MYKLFNNKNPCILDIGFGDGKLLSNIANINTNFNFIGLEVYESGIGNILKQIENSNLSNLKVSNIDAVSFLKKYVQDNSFYGISLFFPDPWPKKRHYKRRIINASFLEGLLMKIKKNGFVKIVTDWENYGERIIELLDGNKKFEKIQDISIYKERILTKFEKRGISQGNRIIDLTYKVK